VKSKFKISCEQLGNKAVIRIDGYISEWMNSASAFKSQLDLLINAGIKDADVYIKSEGGDVVEAAEISNEIKRFPGTTTARLGSLCASAASYIACNCSKVIAAGNTNYMIHKPLGTLSGNADEIESRLKALRNVQDDYAKVYCDKTGISLTKLEAMWKEEFWMSAQEAKTLGFVDQIEGEETITEGDILALGKVGYKNVPKITATATTQPPNIMKEKLILILASMPGITLSASSSDDQLLAIVEGMKVKALKTDSLQRELDEAKANALTASIKAVLDSSENAKQTTPAQRAYYEKRLKENFDETKSHIESLPKLTALTAGIPPAGSGGGKEVDRTNWTYADYQEKDPSGLHELSQKDEAKFNALFEAHYGKK
jgi:ATP-dependent Clp protease protease subunit